jgi:hypothetical protein
VPRSISLTRLPLIVSNEKLRIPVASVSLEGVMKFYFLDPVIRKELPNLWMVIYGKQELAFEGNEAGRKTLKIGS